MVADRSQAAVEVEPLTPTSGPLLETMESMKSRGIDMIYGRWLIEGAPRVLLIDSIPGSRFECIMLQSKLQAGT